MEKNNNNLNAARTAKNDEFYTLLSDIEKEMNNYKDFFNEKIVYCNCNDLRDSNFFKFFSSNFENFGLKKLITTGYNKDGRGSVLVYDGNDVDITELKDNGSYDSEECIEFLKQADVVVTNPPFSLFRDYVKQLMEYNKKFLVIGNSNAVTYKDIFSYIKDNKIWYGVTMYGCQQSIFIIPNTTKDTNSKYRFCDGQMRYTTIINTAAWFTNIPHKKRNIPLVLHKKYNETDFQKYDNFDAINISKVVEIPEDYKGVMGVPISFLGKHCPTQFEIVGLANSVRYIGDFPCLTIINGKKIYNRLLIKRCV